MPMTVYEERTKCDQWLRLGLILLVVYFSQVYPFVHFHHSHDDGGFPIKISMHPIDVNPDDTAGHHKGGHDFHRLDRNVDQNATLSYSRYTLSLIDPLSLPYRTIAHPDNEQISTLWAEKGSPLPESILVDLFDCRGPPTRI